MKTYLCTILGGLLVLISFTLSAQTENTVSGTDDEAGFQEYMTTVDTTNYGGNLSLEAVAELFRTSEDLADFEKKLNDTTNQVNNFDLNGDGEVDYLRVVDHQDGEAHVIVIQAVVEKDTYQDVASIDLVKEGDKVTMQIVGDEDIYGSSYYLEPSEEQQEEVSSYSTVVVIYSVGYTPYYSPYYWGYYPYYYYPRPPYYYYHYHWHIYYRHYRYHRYHYHRTMHARHHHARAVHHRHHHKAAVRAPKYHHHHSSRPPSYHHHHHNNYNKSHHHNNKTYNNNTHKSHNNTHRRTPRRR